MIELAQVCAGYAHKQVLYDVSLCFAPHTVTCIVGPNGCGTVSYTHLDVYKRQS